MKRAINQLGALALITVIGISFLHRSQAFAISSMEFFFSICLGLFLVTFSMSYMAFQVREKTAAV